MRSCAVGLVKTTDPITACTCPVSGCATDPACTCPQTTPPISATAGVGQEEQTPGFATAPLAPSTEARGGYADNTATGPVVAQENRKQRRASAAQRRRQLRRNKKRRKARSR